MFSPSALASVHYFTNTHALYYPPIRVRNTRQKLDPGKKAPQSLWSEYQDLSRLDAYGAAISARSSAVLVSGSPLSFPSPDVPLVIFPKCDVNGAAAG